MQQRKKAHFQGKEPPLEQLLRFLRFKKIINHIPPGSYVLDLGCGYEGMLLEKISQSISSGTGLDIAVKQDHAHSKIRLVPHDLNSPIPSPDGTFDAAISLANLEHLERTNFMFKEIFRVLRPGGKLLLTAPSPLGRPVLEFLSFVGAISRQEIKDHKKYFNKKMLTDYCQKAGFSSCQHEYFQFGMNNFLQANK